MKIKYIFITLLIILLLISISQVFSIPPYAGDIYSVYKSGYFEELEKGFDIIKESFLNIKMMSRPAHAWIFLKDIGNKYDIDIKVYNSRGTEVPAPGETGTSRDEEVIKILNSLESGIHSEIKIGKYFSAVPVLLENRCRFCHNTERRKKIIGVLTFKRSYNPFIYYSSERIILFSAFSLVLLFLLFVVIKWDPGRVSRELFDKK